MRGLSLVVASGGHSSSQRAGLSLSRHLLLRSTGSRRTGSVVVAHGPSCSAACRIFPDQGSNPCPLHWQADSQPLRHQGSPTLLFLNQAERSFLNLILQCLSFAIYKYGGCATQNIMDFECQPKIKYFRNKMECTREKTSSCPNLTLKMRKLKPRKKVNYSVSPRL